MLAALRWFTRNYIGIIAATAAIIAIFLPVAFMEGVIGKYFFSIRCYTFSSSALSLPEALTLTLCGAHVF